ncbi:MAG TPA: type VI secretion system ATPase TssH [Gemmataceae bacterium]
MATVNPRSLIDRLNPACRRALEAAAGLCLSKTHYHVEIEHWFLKLLETSGTDLAPLLRHYDVEPARARQEINQALEKMKTGNGRPPDLSFDILDLIREAWVLASLEYGANRVRSAHLLAAMTGDRNFEMRLRTFAPSLGKISGEKLRKELGELLKHIDSEEAEVGEAGPSGDGPAAARRAGAARTEALDQFTQNLTERARKGEIDPVVGRDNEIRQVIDILTRRRQNNPILTGKAGVGKTAVVEGLALRIIAGDVPGPLKQVDLRVLDLGLLQAGAGVKGEFENRLKSVINEVKASPKPVILFIDEAHTLIGAGGAAGQGDAANLLKPALARGELRTIAATTFKEYKQYFEKDAALKRRFQQVRVEEPDIPAATRMLRGLVRVLERHHGVRILDEAVGEACRLSARYISDRQLPDKGVSLLDTACARVALSQSATPPPLEDCRREIDHLGVEIDFLHREQAAGQDHSARIGELSERKRKAEERFAALEAQLEKERELVEKIRAARARLEEGPANPASPSPGKEGPGGGEGSDAAKLQAELVRLDDELRAVQGETPLVYPVVNAQAVAGVVAAWTGIPIGKMVRDEIQTVLNLKDRLRERVVGQDHALEAIAQRIRTARADLVDPRRPIGVFLLVGPSGVGKTETAIALAELLYGGDRNMVTVNMSEFKEEAKISRLTGGGPMYVGFGEGGVLTNAVKNRPHSIVLLDEIEKAHESVQEIFYQVFDKGTLQNDVGEEVNFKNTIIFLTSNVGTDTIMKACADPETVPDVEGLQAVLRPDLLKAFKPALLGRMTVVPYFPLSDEVLRQIIQLQLNRIALRLRDNHKADFRYSPEVIAAIAGRCKEVESGARNVDHILTGTVLPTISREILTRMAEGRKVHRVEVGVGGDGQFTYAID